MKKYKPTKTERRKYVLKEKRDLQILIACKELEKKNLTKTDSEVVKLIKIQLERNWRKPLLKVLKKLRKKYRRLN